MASVAPTSFRKWPSAEFPAYLKFQSKLWQTLREFHYYKEKPDFIIDDDDEWKQNEDAVFDKRNYYLRQILHHYEKSYQISIVITRLQGTINALFKVPKPRIKNSIQYERTLGMAIICMYPIMPSFSAQLWQSFRDVASFTENEFDLEKEIWCQKFPHIDPNYNLELICEVYGKEVCTVKVPRAILDNLDLNVAVEMALEQPEVEKRVGRETCEVISYKVEPNYQATLNIRCAEKEKRKLSNANANIDK
jgi:leucyl-tRNA synthetase